MALPTGLGLTVEVARDFRNRLPYALVRDREGRFVWRSRCVVHEDTAAALGALFVRGMRGMPPRREVTVRQGRLFG